MTVWRNKDVIETLEPPVRMRCANADLRIVLYDLAVGDLDAAENHLRWANNSLLLEDRPEDARKIRGYLEDIHRAMEVDKAVGPLEVRGRSWIFAALREHPVEVLAVALGLLLSGLFQFLLHAFLAG